MIEYGKREGLKRAKFFALALIAGCSLASCSSKVLKADNSHEILQTTEFDRAYNVVEIEASKQSGTFVRLPGPRPELTQSTLTSPLISGVTPEIPGAPVQGAASTSKGKGGKNSSKPLVGRKNKKPEETNAASATAVSAPAPLREPQIEDAEGFSGRRPIVDPFHVGEKVTLELSYFGVVAGDMTLETRPFVAVNGRKSYRFAGTARSTSVFAMFYAVDDWFETFVDFETFVPYSYSLHVKESKQLREARTIFDWTKNRAFFWDKKINAEKKLEEKKYEWDLNPYSQNIFSAFFYLRTFKLTPGKKLAYRVAHENENLVVTGEVLRREKISTAAGDFNTVVVKPKVEINGHFKPTGDVFMWLTDDDRKFLVRIEAKIKIGTVVGVAKAIERGP